MQCIVLGQNIKSRKRPSVRPESVTKIVTSLMDRSSTNAEHS